MDASLATTQENERAGDIIGARIRDRRIKPRLAIQDLFLRKRNLPAQSKVEC